METIVIYITIVGGYMGKILHILDESVALNKVSSQRINGRVGL